MGRASTKENKSIYQLTREELKLTREKASEMTGFMSAEHIEKIENGKINIQPDDVLTLAQWISFVAVCVTSGVFRLLGSVFIGTAIMSCAFGIDPISEMWRMLAIGAAIFLVPEVGEWFILRIATLNHLARHWLVS